MQTPLPPPPQPEARREHTPTPWGVIISDGHASSSRNVIIPRGKTHAERIAVLSVNGAARGCELAMEANAQFIVRACNSHDVLVAALSECEAIMRGARVMLLKLNPNINLKVHDAIAAQAVAALALASGEESK